jgi:cytochrome c biogenesis factor
MWKVVDVVHLNVILGTCLVRLGEMKSVTAFIPSDVLRNIDMDVFFVSFIIHCEVAAA